MNIIIFFEIVINSHISVRLTAHLSKAESDSASLRATLLQLYTEILYFDVKPISETLNSVK